MGEKPPPQDDEVEGIVYSVINCNNIVAAKPIATERTLISLSVRFSIISFLCVLIIKKAP